MTVASMKGRDFHVTNGNQENGNQNHEKAHTIRMAIINKVENYTLWQGYGEIGSLVHRWWGCKWCSLCGKQCGGFCYHMIQQLHF